MAIIAKSSITLTSISDSYSVSLSPVSCVVRADYDGTHPDLSNASTLISVLCGDERVPVRVEDGGVTADGGVEATVSRVDDYTCRLAITGLATGILSGGVSVTVYANSVVSLSTRFTFSVERESTMLDWIQDWESNKTEIGGSYLITPKLFVGKRVVGGENVGIGSQDGRDGLYGVYIGPDSDFGHGIYGLKGGVEIFHLNEHGGSIGGWDINDGGIQTQDGALQLLSEGTVYARPSGKDTDAWRLSSDGTGSLAYRRIMWDADGNLSVRGEIEAVAGQIGQWSITGRYIESSHIRLGAYTNEICVYAADVDTIDEHDGVAEVGGVSMYYTSETNYGLIGFLPKTGGTERNVFAIGSRNFIAGWSFDESALWIGNKVNNVSQYTGGNGAITIGTNGLRGSSWYIDADGTASFVGGYVRFNHNDGSIAGWEIGPNRLATDNVSLLSASGSSGLYMSCSDGAGFDGKGASAMVSHIEANGGVYMVATTSSADLSAYGADGSVLFSVRSNGVCSIAGWKFDGNSLYTGEATASGFSQDGCITIAPCGVRGSGWRLENDGSGALAKGNIAWDADGNVRFLGITQQAFHFIDVTPTHGTAGEPSFEDTHLLNIDVLRNVIVRFSQDDTESACIVAIPEEIGYSGVEVRIASRGGNVWLCGKSVYDSGEIATGGESSFVCSSENGARRIAVLSDGCAVRLTAVPNSAASSVAWVVEALCGGIVFEI